MNKSMILLLSSTKIWMNPARLWPAFRVTFLIFLALMPCASCDRPANDQPAAASAASAQTAKHEDTKTGRSAAQTFEELLADAPKSARPTGTSGWNDPLRRMEFEKWSATQLKGKRVRWSSSVRSPTVLFESSSFTIAEPRPKFTFGGYQHELKLTGSQGDDFRVPQGRFLIAGVNDIDNLLLIATSTPNDVIEIVAIIDDVSLPDSSLAVQPDLFWYVTAAPTPSNHVRAPLSLAKLGFARVEPSASTSNTPSDSNFSREVSRIRAESDVEGARGEFSQEPVHLSEVSVRRSTKIAGLAFVSAEARLANGLFVSNEENKSGSLLRWRVSGEEQIRGWEARSSARAMVSGRLRGLNSLECAWIQLEAISVVP